MRPFHPKITNVWNIKKRDSKEPLNMLYVELKPENNNKDIYQTTHVLDYRVKFETPHAKRQIPQCINCQRYSHTKGFCNRKARCVKCAEDHPLAVHEKLNLRNVKCVLCEGNQPMPIIKAARSIKIYKKDISPHYGKRK